MRYRHSPSCAIAFGFAFFIVISLTETYSVPSWYSMKERSNMHQYFLLLCRIIETGDSLSFLGMLFLISFYTSVLVRMDCGSTIGNGEPMSCTPSPWKNRSLPSILDGM
jgi:hypothetical protein